MSAFLVSKHDIDVLVTAYCDLEPTLRRSERAIDGAINQTALGKLLWLENAVSMEFRYALKKRDPDRYRNMLAKVGCYVFTRLEAKPAVIAKAARCYDYQACEHGGYERSAAYNIAAAVMKRFPETLPGYSRAPWGIGERDLAAIAA